VTGFYLITRPGIGLASLTLALAVSRAAQGAALSGFLP
jgi:hypothetical protein